MEFGSLALAVSETPGHTRDHLLLRIGDKAFTGDTLLPGACGRTDLGDGSPDLLWESLDSKIRPLPDRVEVLPAHYGPLQGLLLPERFSSTIGVERATNEALRIPRPRGIPNLHDRRVAAQAEGLRRDRKLEPRSLMGRPSATAVGGARRRLQASDPPSIGRLCWNWFTQDSPEVSRSPRHRTEQKDAAASESTAPALQGGSQARRRRRPGGPLRSRRAAHWAQLREAP